MLTASGKVCSRRAVCKRQLSPEESRAVREFLSNWEDPVDDVAREIRAAVRRGDIDIDNVASIRSFVQDSFAGRTGDLQATISAHAEDGARIGREVAARRLGVDVAFDIVPEQTIRELDDWAVTVSESVSDTLEDEITNYLQGAREQGLSIEDIADEFESEWMENRLHGSHAEQVARDVTVAPSNAGQHSVMQEIDEIIAEQWVTEIDGRERDAHQEADGQIVPVDGTFIVGGEEMRHPGDPRGSVENVTNCRCAIVGVWEDDLSDEEATAIRNGERLNV